MKRLLLAAAALIGAVSAGTAALSATAFGLAGGSAYVLPGDYNPVPSSLPDIGAGTTVWRNAALGIDGPARVTFSYVGTEADYRNSFRVGGTNPDFALDLGAGALSLAFATAGPAGSFANGATTGYYGSIAFFRKSPTLVYALFNDVATSDKDYDDMVVRMEPAPVPLPAAAWLLVGALGGLGALARRRPA